MPESKSKTESEKEPEPKREPRALSNEYHKARKQLMLWAGILFIWELVGIDLEKAKEAGGNAGAIIGAIKSPQAVPWTLLILVAYFLFKVTVEWHQCSSARRALRASKIDFSSVWLVSAIAYVLYFAQAISRVQLADYFSNPSGSHGFGILVSAAIILGALVIRDRFDYRSLIDWVLVLVAPLSLVGGLLISTWTNWHLHWKVVFFTMIIMTPFYGVVFNLPAIWRVVQLRLTRARAVRKSKA